MVLFFILGRMGCRGLRRVRKGAWLSGEGRNGRNPGDKKHAFSGEGGSLGFFGWLASEERFYPPADGVSQFVKLREEGGGGKKPGGWKHAFR